MKVPWRKIRAAALVLGSLLIFFWALLRYPQPLFAQSVAHQNLTLYSDRPFQPEAGAQVLALAYQKLSASPLFSARDHYAVFVLQRALAAKAFLQLALRRRRGELLSVY